MSRAVLLVLAALSLTGCRFDRAGIAAASDLAPPDGDVTLSDGPLPPADLLDLGPAPDRALLDAAPLPDGLPLADARRDLPPKPDTAPPPPPDKDLDGIPDPDDPCPTVANTLLLDDDCVINTGWSSYSGSWSLDSGDFYQQSMGAYCTADHLYRQSFNAPDLYIEVSVSRVSGSTSAADCNMMGVTARSKLPGSKTYQFCGVNLKACSGGCNNAPVGLYGFGWNGAFMPAGPQSMVTTAVSGSFNGPYEVRMTVSGDQVRCWLASKKSSTELAWSADGLGTGTVALFTGTATARFHRVRIYSIPQVCQ